MSDDITTDRETFKAFAEALGAYLEAVGWRAIVVGHPRIQQQPGDGEMHYEFVVRFTGGRKRPAAPEEK